MNLLGLPVPGLLIGIVIVLVLTVVRRLFSTKNTLLGTGLFVTLFLIVVHASLGFSGLPIEWGLSTNIAALLLPVCLFYIASLIRIRNERRASRYQNPDATCTNPRTSDT